MPRVTVNMVPMSHRNQCLLCREMQACGQQSAKNILPRRNCLLFTGLDIDSNTEEVLRVGQRSAL